MATETSGSTWNTSRLSKAQVFNAAKNLRRRYALYYLKRNGGSVELGELAEQVAAWENDTTVENITAEQRKSVYSALYQTHLPRLEDAGVLSYDRHSNVVSFTDRAKNLNLYLASDPRTTVQWNRLFLGIGVAGTLAAALCGLGVTPFGSVPGVVLAGLLAVVVLVVALMQTYDRRRWYQRFDGAAPDFALELEE